MTYKLTCLTPTLVGDGQELAPIDYMVWKDQVNVLDQRRIFKLFAKGPRLDGYLAQIKRSDRLDFASWGGLAQNYAGRRIAFEHPSLTQHFERAMTQDLFIQTFATLPGGIYVPGSALKGALRTGAMFAGLHEEHWKRMLEQLSGERPTRRVSSIVEDRAVKGQMKGVMAGDSAPLEAAAGRTLVYLTRASTLVGTPEKLELAWKTVRGSSKNPVDGLPSFVEMAPPGTTFQGSWKGGSAAMASANKFSAAILENHFQYASKAGLHKLAEAVDALRQKIATLEAHQCMLPLGWGGGILGKAAIADGGPEHVRQVMRKLPFYARALQTGLPFPKTRRIVFLADQPATLPGWTLLETSSPST